MTIEFRCPQGHKLSVDDSLAGRKARCPACQQKMYIPQDNTQRRQRARPAPETSPTIHAETALQRDDDDLLSLPLAATARDQQTRPTGAYIPDPGKVQTVRLLAAGLALVSAFCLLPVIHQTKMDLLRAPDWARIVLLLSILQLVYTVWMVSLPDWCTVWVAALIAALTAALYGMALAIVLFTPLDTPLVIGLNNVRHSAAPWCFCVVSLCTLMAYAAARVARTWRRAFEMSLQRGLERYY